MRSKDNLSVLDLGIGSDNTLGIFSELGAERVCFADVGKMVGRGYPGSSVGILPFTPKDGIQFDICLLWDYLNVMSQETFEQFGEELGLLINKDTLIYGFLANTVHMPMFFHRYTFLNRRELELADTTEYVARYPKSRQDFLGVFKQAKFLNMTRYPGNRQEILATL